MHRLKAWLRVNGFSIIREGAGPQGIELTVLGENGRVMQLVHRAGSDPGPVIEYLESILYGEMSSTLV